jgi:hypothetical protein
MIGHISSPVAGAGLLPIPPIAAGGSDSDAWGRLADQLARHPEWSDLECREIVRAWVDCRRKGAWQSELLRIWPRWKRHHEDLRKGLAQIETHDWAEKCRYCEIWSASRPVMSPFCGVAEILLEVLQTEERVKPTKPAVRPGEVLIISAEVDLEAFSEFGASRQLVWALENCGLSWSLASPWEDLSDIDPHDVKGVVFWSYRQLYNDFVYHAMKVERICRARRIPIVNSILRGWDARHSTLLHSFHQAGIRCPKFQTFCDIDEIELPYPLILRVDGVHRGQEAHLVWNADDAQDLVNRKRGQFLNSKSGGVFPPPNLAIEYIDVADSKGQFHKYRAYVVGSDVVPRHKTVGTNWLVNFSSADSVAGSERALDFSSSDLEVLALAGRATGSDVTALDYSRGQDGEYVFWEANRLFRMNGDQGYGLPERVSESKSKRRAATDRKLGECLVALLQERFVYGGN